MSLASMTGFGSAEGDLSLPSGRGMAWAWEIKTVNGRGLDLRLRLPTGFDALDARLRGSLASLGRGTVQANLTVTPRAEAVAFAVDPAALAAIARAVAQVREQIECAPPTADGILALRGVLATADDRLAGDDLEQMQLAVEDGFSRAVDALRAARTREGERIAAALRGQLAEMASLVQSAHALAPAALAHHQQQLRTSLAELLGDRPVSADRVLEEAAMLAIRTDVREEIDRLSAHIAQAQTHLQSSEPVGRALDFLAQELAREANTLTTKAPMLELKRIGLVLKAVIDQFKEQVQNIV